MPWNKKAKMKPPAALKYRGCDVAELQKFVLDRTGNMRRKKNKATCIQKLQQLDLATTFRFLDMLPEFRNRIYELLLCHDSEAIPKMFADTALLRTCRQIYDEAYGILYAQSFPRVGPYFPNPEMMPKYRLIRKIHLRIPDEEAVTDGLLAFTFVNIGATYDTNNALILLKISRGPFYVEDIREEDLKHFGPLKALPAATKLELNGFDTEEEKMIREHIGRPAN